VFADQKSCFDIGKVGLQAFRTALRQLGGLHLVTQVRE